MVDRESYEPDDWNGSMAAPITEPEPEYKEKINVKWYELLILAALAWAPFMLGLLLKLLNS